MGDEEEDACNTELGLGLGLGLSLGLGVGVGVGGLVPKCDRIKKEKVVCLDLSIPLHSKEEGIDHDEGNCYVRREEGSCSKTIFEEYKFGLTSNKWNLINDDDQNNNNCSRKKLRLTKQQSIMLEESFKLHTTLNQIQKQTLAAKLNLRTRQVEVWFQNRRARTKSKQSEVECELLKKCCESLSHENRRLQKELRELRLFNLDQSHDQLPMAVTLTICPSCSQQHQ